MCLPTPLQSWSSAYGKSSSNWQTRHRFGVIAASAIAAALVAGLAAASYGLVRAKAATREFNQLIEDLAARRLDRTEAFRRMQQLEDKLLEGREADAKALEEAMKKIGEEMKAVLPDLARLRIGQAGKWRCLQACGRGGCG